MNHPYFRDALPSPNLEARRRLFAGDVYLLRACAAAQALVRNVIDLIAKELETEDIRHAHLYWADDELFQKFGALRRRFYLEDDYHEAVRAIAAECGFDPASIAFDPIRLRVVMPGGSANPLAAPVYYPHRDTWYAHPQALIVWWIPLHDLSEGETFVFYPDHFDSAVENDSEIFDYSDWVKDGPGA